MPQVYVNNGYSTLSAAVLIGDTSLFCQGAEGSRFPTIAAPDYCFLTLENAGGNIEIVKVTAHTAGSSAFTVQRAQQGTTARAWAIGDLIELRLTSDALTAFETDIDALQASRSIRAGDTYSGTHDFSAGVINVKTLAPGTSGNQAASLDFVLNAALSGVLPGQAGNNGGLITTNGTSVSWSNSQSVTIQTIQFAQAMAALAFMNQ